MLRRFFMREEIFVEKRILNYRKYIDDLLASSEQQDWEKIIQIHLIQVGFFQHERLIHLIVTVTFAIMEIISLGLTIFQFTPFLGALSILLLILLIPYIRHYYILENEVQKMYEQYDRMLQHD